MHASRVLVIIPAYNESENILSVASHIIAAGYDYIIVNDGSSDSTLKICKENDLNVLDLSQNLGIGGAVQAGHKFAQQNGYQIDVQFDGDGQHDARYIPALVQEIEAGADIVVGSRYLNPSGSGFQSTLMRRIGKSWLSLCLELLCHQRISDPTSGFRVCGARAIDLFCESYPIDYPEPESLALASRLGLTISEISVSMHERQGGTSSINAIASIYYMVKVTLAIILAALSDARGKR